MPLDGTVTGAAPADNRAHSTRRGAGTRQRTHTEPRAASYRNGADPRRQRLQEPSGELIPSGVRRTVKLGSGPGYVEERKLATQITGHAPGSKMPDGAIYFSSGPDAAQAVPVPAPNQAPQHTHQPH